MTARIKRTMNLFNIAYSLAIDFGRRSPGASPPQALHKQGNSQEDTTCSTLTNA